MYLYEGLEPIVQATEGDSFQFEGPDVDTGQYYMGHTQGPTSSQREFDPKTSHPFNHFDWSVAHNGVLSNGKSLASKYGVDNPVDSAVIPKMLWSEYIDLYDPDIWKWVRQEKAIAQVCNELAGTFSCWIHNNETNHVYIVRNGCTLFANNQGEFSSTNPGDMDPLKEGIIYRVDYENKHIHDVGKFEPGSPFFIL